mmetsp:Transcript_7141/g.10417  ORF Transcript_7141/g.10417 Transcript_7141/m.10417 type:complete len:239 (-) Transcript_7141:964-1680(-)
MLVFGYTFSPRIDYIPSVGITRQRQHVALRRHFYFFLNFFHHVNHTPHETAVQLDPKIELLLHARSGLGLHVHDVEIIRYNKVRTVQTVGVLSGIIVMGMTKGLVVKGGNGVGDGLTTLIPYVLQRIVPDPSRLVSKRFGVLRNVCSQNVVQFFHSSLIFGTEIGMSRQMLRRRIPIRFIVDRIPDPDVSIVVQYHQRIQRGYHPIKAQIEFLMTCPRQFVTNVRLDDAPFVFIFVFR